MVLLENSNIQLEWAFLWNVPQDDHTNVLRRCFHLAQALRSKIAIGEQVHYMGPVELSPGEKLANFLEAHATYEGATGPARSAMDDHIDELLLLAKDLGTDKDTLFNMITGLRLAPFGFYDEEDGERVTVAVLHAQVPDHPPVLEVGLPKILCFVSDQEESDDDEPEEDFRDLRMRMSMLQSAQVELEHAKLFPESLKAFCGDLADKLGSTVVVEMFPSQGKSPWERLAAPYYTIILDYRADQPPADADEYLKELIGKDA